MSIYDNLSMINDRISHAVQKAGREDEVKLIAVSKTVDVQTVNEAIRLGVKRIGENRVQELIGKYDKLLPVEKHLIGQLQSNKVKYIAGKVTLIHSLDRMSLALELSRMAKLQAITIDALVQINIGCEYAKGGVLESDLMPFLDKLQAVEGVRVKGLMAIPPISHGDEVREYFARVYALAQAAKARGFASMSFDELSMGMSGDFEKAILEGATYVRIGTALFGNRIYNDKT